MSPVRSSVSSAVSAGGVSSAVSAGGETPLLETRGLVLRFGGHTAVNRLDLTLRRGEVLGLIGPNGAGKTTIFNLLSGRLRPNAGRIRLLGRDITGLPPHRACRLGIARTFQVPRPFLSLTVFESVLVGARFGRRVPGAAPERETAELLATTGLERRKNDPVRALNLADRKRLDLARAIATRPRALLVDEVAAGLNPAEVRDAVSLLREVHARGLGMIYVEHVMEAVMELSDRIQVIEHGETIACDAPAAVAADPAVIRAYLGGAAEGRP